jgi:citrate lyase beta subunit
VQHLAGHPVHLASQPQRRTRALAAQVEVAVLEPHLLVHRSRLVFLDRERQRRRLVEDLHLAGDDLDLAGRQVRVRVALRTRRDGADDLQAVLGSQPVRGLLVPDHHLDGAAGVPEVDERHAAVIAPPRHPARQDDGLPGVLSAQRACGMGTDHEFS